MGMLGNLISLFTGDTGFKHKVPRVTEEDKRIIAEFAAGDDSLRERAVDIYNSYDRILTDWLLMHPDRVEELRAADRCTEYQYMNEYCHKVPDAVLREMYRKRIISEHGLKDKRRVSAVKDAWKL